MHPFFQFLKAQGQDYVTVPETREIQSPYLAETVLVTIHRMKKEMQATALWDQISSLEAARLKYA